jgi:hypothetical protein
VPKDQGHQAEWKQQQQQQPLSKERFHHVSQTGAPQQEHTEATGFVCHTDRIRVQHHVELFVLHFTFVL